MWFLKKGSIEKNLLDFMAYMRDNYDYDESKFYHYPVGFSGDIDPLKKAVKKLVVEDLFSFDDDIKSDDAILKDLLNCQRNNNLDIYLVELSRDYHYNDEQIFIILYASKQNFSADGSSFTLDIPEQFNKIDLYFNILKCFERRELSSITLESNIKYNALKYKKKGNEFLIYHQTEVSLHSYEYYSNIDNLPFLALRNSASYGDAAYYELIIKIDLTSSFSRAVHLALHYKNEVLKETLYKAAYALDLYEKIFDFLFPFNCSDSSLNPIGLKSTPLTKESIGKDYSYYLTIHKLLKI